LRLEQIGRIVNSEKNYQREELLEEINTLRNKITTLETEKHQLREKCNFFKGLVDSVRSVGLVATDTDGFITLFNTGAEHILGYDAVEVIAKTTPLKFHLPSELARMSEGLSKTSGREVDGFEIFKDTVLRKEESIKEWTMVRKDGSRFKAKLFFKRFTNSNGETIGYLCMIEDITEHTKVAEERQKLEEQLNQAQKMEAIGTLAGGIAHDFNNILSIIFGYAELAEDDIPQDHPAHPSLGHIVKAAGRAKDLVQQILTFRRQAEHELRPLKLVPMIKEALQMLRSTLPSTIEIKSNISPTAGIVMADPSQLHQVIMNLCVNSGHAMRDTGGTLTVSLENTKIDSKSILVSELEPGDYVKITVKDTGYGISPENLSRIFDPYFTTKKKEEGTGLGLAVVHGIIKKHGGDIFADSQPGQGAEFSIYLPSAPVENSETTAAVETETPVGLEHILLVDDEQVLIETSRKQLERLGYKVTARTSSMDALEYFKINYDQVDLVLTDQTMPNMTGLQLTRQIHLIRPDVPVVLLTGFSETIDESELPAMGIDALLMKPFVRKDIALVIREVLDKKR